MRKIRSKIRTFFTSKIDGLITTALEQVLNNRFIQAGGHHTFWLCRGAPEAVQNPVERTGCKMQAGTVYSNWDNGPSVRLNDPNSQWETSSKVVESSRMRILGDFKFQTDEQLLVTNQTSWWLTKSRRQQLWQSQMIVIS